MKFWLKFINNNILKIILAIINLITFVNCSDWIESILIYLIDLLTYFSFIKMILKGCCLIMIMAFINTNPLQII